MGDLFTRYEIGLSRLLDQLGERHPLYIEALSYQQRLQENLEKARRHGDTRNLSAERAEVTDQLNRLAIETTGRSFNDLVGPAAGPSGLGSSAVGGAGGVESPRGPTTNVYGSIGIMHSGTGSIYTSNAHDQASSPLDLRLALLRQEVSRRVSDRELLAKSQRKLDDLLDAIRQADIDDISAVVGWLQRRLSLDAALKEMLSDPAVLEEIRKVDPSAAQEFTRRFGILER